MAAKHDQSHTKQVASTANTTNNVTKTIADSYNQTLNLVTNQTSTTGGAGFSGLTVSLIGGGVALFAILAIAAARR